MKISKKLLLIGTVILLILASCFVGSHLTAQTYSSSRAQRCSTLLSFAIDKVEKENLADQHVVEALISNIYAAYQFCDDPYLATQLHDLWNSLIFEKEHYIGKEDTLVNQLKAISELMKMED